MHPDQSPQAQALQRLGAFIGDWQVAVDLPNAPAGRLTFEWALEGKYVIERADVDDPNVPDTLAIISVNPETGSYTQHYFDSRGVTRVYAMTFDGEVWTLLRVTPDFSPLPFSQRYTGVFRAGGSKIAGVWEQSDDARHWEKDFDLTYTRIR
jgi:hypothetical protein